MKNLLLIISSVLLLASCARPKPLIYKDVERVSVRNAGLTSVTLKIEMKIYNPNKYSLLLKDPHIGVYINDKHLGDATIDDKYAMPANDTFLLPAIFTVDVLTVLPNAYQVIRNKEVTLRLDGSLKAGVRHHIGKGGIFIGLPVHYEGKQRIDIKL